MAFGEAKVPELALAYITKRVEQLKKEATKLKKKLSATEAALAQRDQQATELEAKLTGMLPPRLNAVHRANAAHTHETAAAAAGGAATAAASASGSGEQSSAHLSSPPHLQPSVPNSVMSTAIALVRSLEQRQQQPPLPLRSLLTVHPQSCRRGAGTHPAERCLVIFNPYIAAACWSHDALEGIILQLQEHRSPGRSAGRGCSALQGIFTSQLASSGTYAGRMEDRVPIAGSSECGTRRMVQWRKTPPSGLRISRCECSLSRRETQPSEPRRLKQPEAASATTAAITTPATASASNPQAQGNSLALLCRVCSNRQPPQQQQQRHWQQQRPRQPQHPTHQAHAHAKRQQPHRPLPHRRLPPAATAAAHSDPAARRMTQSP